MYIHIVTSQHLMMTADGIQLGTAINGNVLGMRIEKLLVMGVTR